MQGMYEDLGDGKKQAVAIAQREAGEAKAAADNAATNAVAVRERIAKLKRGDEVDGGTGRQLTQREIIAIIGGPAAARRAVRVATISEAGAFDEMLAEMLKASRHENAVISECTANVCAAAEPNSQNRRFVTKPRPR